MRSLFLIFSLCISFFANAELTTAQIATLKTAIAAENDSTFVALRNGGATYDMAQWYNGQYSPATLAWVSACTAKSLDEGSDYSAYDSVAAGKRDAWALFLQFAPRNLAKTKNRKVVTDVWGNATGGSVAESVLQACTRNITRAENLFGGSTTATTGTVTARKLTWEGSLVEYDIVRALQ